MIDIFKHGSISEKWRVGSVSETWKYSTNGTIIPLNNVLYEDGSQVLYEDIINVTYE